MESHAVSSGSYYEVPVTPTKIISTSPSTPDSDFEASLPRATKKVLWTPEETRVLQYGIETYGVGSWKAILADAEIAARLHPSRTEVSLKDRYRIVWGSRSSMKSHSNTKKERRKRHKWTIQEDHEMLTLFEKIGPQWTTIARRSGLLQKNIRTGTDVRDRIRNKYPELYAASGLSISTSRRGSACSSAGSSDPGQLTPRASLANALVVCTVPEMMPIPEEMNIASDEQNFQMNGFPFNQEYNFNTFQVPFTPIKQSVNPFETNSFGMDSVYQQEQTNMSQNYQQTPISVNRSEFSVLNDPYNPHQRASFSSVDSEKTLTNFATPNAKIEAIANFGAFGPPSSNPFGLVFSEPCKESQALSNISIPQHKDPQSIYATPTTPFMHDFKLPAINTSLFEYGSGDSISSRLDGTENSGTENENFSSALFMQQSTPSTPFFNWPTELQAINDEAAES